MAEARPQLVSRRGRRNSQMPVGDGSRPLRPGAVSRNGASQRVAAGVAAPRPVAAEPQPAPRLDTLPDADLVARAKAGDREAFDPLYRRYAGDVARHAVARVASWGRGLDVADDAAADTWATAIEKIDQYQGLPCEGSPFKAWLYGILKHQVVKTVRADRAVPVDDAAALDRAVRDRS